MDLAWHLRIPLTLVQVVGAEPADLIGAQRAKRRLLRVARCVRRQEIACASQVLVGMPDVELVRLARAVNARWFSLACRGRPGLDCWILGTVVDHLVQRAPVPVIVQTDRTLDQTKLLDRDGPILVTLDGSELAELALPEAINLAKALDRPILLARANDPLETVGGESPANPYAMNALAEASEGYLYFVAEWVRAHGLTVTTTSKWESPATFIQEIAQREKVGLICMATRGRSGLGKLALGGIAAAVLRETSCPVLLVGPMAAEGHRSPLASAGELR
jgi:nucleotide-binding universal stress UspA family protein